MNPATALALICDLYEQIAQLHQENQRLREALAQQAAPANGAPPEG